MELDVPMFYNLFWSESFWLPVGYRWKDLESTAERRKADVKDLWIIPVLVLIITIFRVLFEKYIAFWFCKYIGIKEEKKFLPNDTLEKHFKKVNKFPTNKEISTLASDTSSGIPYIRLWFRRRRKYSKNALMKKATETCYRALFYMGLFAYGSHVVLRTNWIWDNSLWVTNYTEHEITTEMQWYYHMEIAFYFALLFSQFFDTKRKDFYQMLIHHVATLTLLLGSYITSYYRVGCVIIYIHDAADVWLESAKLANYAKIQKVCDTLFGVFAIVFTLTRLVYYPIWVAYGYFNYTHHTQSIFQRFQVAICFLILFLNFYWGFLIARMAYRLIIVGNVVKDSRSDTENDDDDE